MNLYVIFHGESRKRVLMLFAVCSFAHCIKKLCRTHLDSRCKIHYTDPDDSFLRSN